MAGKGMKSDLVVPASPPQTNPPRITCPRVAIQTLFEQQVRRTPEAIALVFGGQQLTYRELGQRADELAQALRSLGVQAESRVGLLVERSLEMVVGILGVLKAGGAYFPLDPSLPAQRLAFILTDGQPGAVLTQGWLRPLLSSWAGPVLSFDQLPAGPNGPLGTGPASVTSPDQLAYVLYTSGSTGRPKGVEVTQRNVVSLFAALDDLLGHPAPGIWLAVSNFAFDVSVTELLWTLTRGFRVVLCSETVPLQVRQSSRMSSPQVVRSLVSVGAMIEQHGVTHLQCTPTLARLLVTDAAVRRALGQLQELLLVGEVLAPDLAETLLRCMHGRLLNLYGPTETTIYATADRVTRADEITIGRPLNNSEVHILDAHAQPVPMGVAGEIYIGGDGVARGYLNLPDLTSERFVPHPTRSQSGERLYRSGDLARYRTDGRIEFLGRIDRQVKIRGCRVELGEIETVLSRHPAVEHAVVCAHEGQLGMLRLVAYVVPCQEKDAAPADLIPRLRAHLVEALPDFMVPAAIIRLEHLPLTPSGKVDRNALSALEPVPADHEGPFAVPATPVEEMLAGCWARILGLEEVGVEDNFFTLGGDSFFATQLILRLRNVFRTDWPVAFLFEAPTVRRLAAWLAAHEPRPGWVEKAALLYRKNKGMSTDEIEDSAVAPRLIPRLRERNEMPPSFGQRQLWFFNSLFPETPLNNIAQAVRLRGPIDLPVFQQTLTEIARRHEVLRTCFRVHQDGLPVQAVALPAPVELALASLEHLPPNERQSQARRLALEASRTPFDLAAGPLWQSRLIRLDRDDHLWLLTMHHAISDGWSMEIFFREFSTLYRAFGAGQPSPLAELPIQFGDFAAWQRQEMESETLARQRDYWRHQLRGAPPVLKLPADRPRPDRPSFRSGQQTCVLALDLVRALRSLGQQEGVTLFVLLLTVFQTLLQRLTGQDDLVVGTPSAGRNREETVGMIGFFVNTLVVRTRLTAEQPFRAALHRTWDVVFQAFAHQELPFDRLVEELQPERSLSHSPVFQVFFNMMNYPESEILMPGVTAEALGYTELHSKFDLTLYVRERKDAVELRLVYQQDLFDTVRMAGFLAQYIYLLEQVVASPDTAIGGFSLVPPCHQDLLPDPRQPLDEPPQVRVPALIAGWARATPDQAAVMHGERNWTYRQLMEGAEELVKSLRTLGVVPGEVVAVTGQRSFGLMAALVAVLQSEAVLLPVDPELPAERQRLMLEQAQSRWLMRVGGSGIDEETIHRDAILSVDPQSGRPSSVPHRGGLRASGPESGDDRAYVMFTSGTTGIPRAVLGRHPGLSHFLKWQRHTFQVGPGDRCAQLTGLSFDVVLREVFLPLTSGATLCLPAEREEEDPERFWHWLRAQQITVLHAVPTVTQFWLDHGLVGEPLSALRWTFFAGEPLTGPLVRRWRQQVSPSGGIVNLYGPTETTLAKCFHMVGAAFAPQVQPVGRPLPQTQALVLNQAGQLCGIGEPGEIVIRTPFRTRGYANDPAETQRKFRPNPWRADPADLLYWTGDHGRYRPDGSLEILGRIDDQVKVRGVRIEPAEVASVLARHPHVRSCAVVPVRDEEGQTILIGYIVPAPDQSVSLDDLDHYLRQNLPAALVPTGMMLLPELPRTANGKLDRGALPPIKLGILARGNAYRPPHDPLQELLIQIWEESLQARPIGIQDNFFALGGHSLLAVRMLARIEQVLQKRLPLTTLFHGPTVEKLAHALLKPDAAHPPAPVITLRTGSRRPFFWLHGDMNGGGLYCCSLVQHFPSDRPFHALAPQGAEEGQPLLRTIEAMAVDHLRNLRAIQAEEPYLLGGYCNGGLVAYEMARRLNQLGQSVDLLVMLGIEADDTLFRSLWPEFDAEEYQSIYRQPMLVNMPGLDGLDPPRRRQAVLGMYHLAIKNYFLLPYLGRVMVVWPAEQAAATQDPSHGWAAVAGEVETQVIPGNHQTCVTYHVQVLAECLGRCLERYG